ncbi:MAG: HDOD domain-containing protein [Acidobacteria bacterium]|nr:HDOD domain-containing protein [Acidobacteriota bacterium]
MPITPQELIQNLGDLPPLPQVAAQVLRLVADPDSTTDDLQKVISTDQALTSQILKIANSAMFGMMREVRTVTQAIMTLGFSTIKSVVIAASAKNLYSRGSVGLQERILWEHALVTALACRGYARSLRFPRGEEAFVGGLLHDIGKSVMGIKFPERYGALVRQAYNERLDSRTLELDTFGFDHCMVGEALLKSWNLAESLEAAVRWHHDPGHAPEGHQVLAAIVALGNQIPPQEAGAQGYMVSQDQSEAEALAILRLDETAYGEHRQTVFELLDRDKGMIADL